MTLVRELAVAAVMGPVCFWLGVLYGRGGSDEHARRKFMQLHGHSLGWGLVGENRESGVRFTSECWGRPYECFTCIELYEAHGWDGTTKPIPDDVRDATERAVIDAAMRAYRARSAA